MKRGQQRQQERIGLVTKVARLLLCAGLLAPVYGAEDLRALAGGADQEIGAGETRVYELAVERGQFVEVVLDQKGGNGVDLAIAGPDNQQIAECDIPNGGTGPQVVAIIATAGGTHRVRIRYSELPSGDERLPVRFAVRSVIVRHPTAEDRTKAEAEIAYTRARQLQRQLSAESRRAAVEEYDRATALFESFGDTYRVGIIRNAVGLVQARLGSMRPA